MPSPRGVKVTLDKPRVLRFTNRSLIMLEDDTGMTAAELMERVKAGSLKAVNQLIWAGLVHADPDLPLSDVYDMVDMAKIGEIAEGLGRAVAMAFGDGEADEEAAEGKGEAATPKKKG